MRTYIFYLIAILLTGFSAFAGDKLPSPESTQQKSKAAMLDFTMPENFTFEYSFFETTRVVECKMIKDGNNIQLDMDWVENNEKQARRILFKYTGTVWEVWLNDDPNKSKTLTNTKATFKDLFTALGSQAHTQYTVMLVLESRGGKPHKAGTGEFNGIPCDTYSGQKDGSPNLYAAPGTTFCLTMGRWGEHPETGKKVWVSEVQPKSFSTGGAELSGYTFTQE